MTEKKELARLQREAARPQGPFYLIIVMAVLTIIYVVDEVTSNVNGAMQPYALFELFHITSHNVNSPEYSNAINIVAPWQMISYLFLLVSPFYKALSDRFGRRIFLTINTIGMGLGMLFVMTARNVVQYIFGMFFMMFFTPNDMQVLYILETAPKTKRATCSSFAKGVALISVSLIGVLSRIFLKEDVPGSWRMVYLIPVAVALLVGAVSRFLVRETPVFVKQRLKYLSMTSEQRMAAESSPVTDNGTDAMESNSRDVLEGGVFRALRFIFTSPQLRWIFIAGFLFYAATFYTFYYATVLEGAMDTKMVGNALIIYPFFNGLVTMLSGFFSDRMGRKKVCVLLGSITMTGLLAFVLACRLGWGPLPAGIAYGSSVGGLWSISDTILLTMPAESAPSGLRSSVMGTISVMISSGNFIGQMLFIIGQNYLRMDTLFLIICIPFMVISLLIMMIKVKETKNVDLDKI